MGKLLSTLPRGGVENALEGESYNGTEEKIVVKSLEKGINFTELCRDFGIRTKRGYKWKERFLEGGFPALEDHR